MIIDFNANKENRVLIPKKSVKSFSLFNSAKLNSAEGAILL